MAIVSTEICSKVNQGLTFEQFNRFNSLVDWSAKAYRIVTKKAILKAGAKNEFFLAKLLVIAGMQQMGIEDFVIDAFVGQEKMAGRAKEWIKRRCLHDKPFEKKVESVKRLFS